MSKDAVKNNGTSLPLGLLQKNLEGYIRVAESEKDVDVKLSKFVEIQEWLQETESEQLVEMKKKVCDEVESLLKMKEELSIKGKDRDQLFAENKKLKEQLKSSLELQKMMESKLVMASELLDHIKEFDNKHTNALKIQIAKNNSMYSAQEMKESNDKIESMTSDLTNLKENVKKYQTALKKFKEATNKHNESLRKQKMEKDVAEAKVLREQKSIESKKLESERLAEVENKKKIEKEDYEKKMNSDKFKYRENEEIEKFYSSMLKLNPNMVKLKEMIDNVKTLSEAQMVYFNNTDLIVGELKPLKESENKTETKKFVPAEKDSNYL